jgi:hypothetical protein
MADKRGPKQAARKKAWAQANRDKLNAYHREYHAKRKSDATYQNYRRKSYKTSRRKAKYGLPKGGFELLVELQQGRCAICQGQFDLRLRVDHCHSTGRIRGLLCANCNSGIGLLQESPEIFAAAARYLK